MDAVDLNWCLSCGQRIELEGPSPYCSQSCMNSEQPSASSSALPSSRPSFASFDHPSFHDDDYSYLASSHGCSSAHPRVASPSRSPWVGGSDAGIRAWASSIPRGTPPDPTDSPSAALRPKLLLQPRSPVKPSLAMSRAQPAPAEPSRPILTPQQSLPSLSLSRSSTPMPSSSMVSLTTGSSSYSVVTPDTGSEIGSVRDAPLPPAQGSFLGGFRAQLRALVAPATPQKEARRSTTLTSSRRDVRIADADSDVESVAGRGTYKVRRPRSPVAMYYVPEMMPKKKESTKENCPAPRRTPTEDHPAYRTRGRKASRVPS